MSNIITLADFVGTAIEKSFQNEINNQPQADLSKGGEGSKGGKVIGHTRSGKPIYGIKTNDLEGVGRSRSLRYVNQSLDNWSPDDHDDAIEAHIKHGKERDKKGQNSLPQAEAVRIHNKQKEISIRDKQKHDLKQKYFDSLPEVLGKTQSGKSIYKDKYHINHDNFTKQDHHDAADLHYETLRPQTQEDSPEYEVHSSIGHSHKFYLGGDNRYHGDELRSKNYSKF